MRQTRNHSLDLMRVLCAFGIVWAHLQCPGMEIGYVALALFLMLTTQMAVGSAETRSFGRFMRGRFWRIFLPWLGWSGLYLAVDAFRSGDPARMWRLTDWQSLLVGSEVHLWFLPFVVLTAPLAFLTTRLVKSRLDLWKCVFPMGLIGAGALAMHDNGAMDAPWAQWASAAIPLFYGLVSAAAKRHGAVLAPVVFVVFATMIPVYFWQSEPAFFFLVAALVFEVFCRLKIRADWLPMAGALSFGVYLVHPFVLLIWYKVTLDQLPRSIGAVVVFVGSVVLAWVLQWLWARLVPHRKAAPCVARGGLPSSGQPA